MPQVSMFFCVLSRQTDRNLSGREVGTITSRCESSFIMSANMSLAARAAGLVDLQVGGNNYIYVVMLL